MIEDDTVNKSGACVTIILVQNVIDIYSEIKMAAWISQSDIQIAEQLNNGIKRISYIKSDI